MHTNQRALEFAFVLAFAFAFSIPNSWAAPTARQVDKHQAGSYQVSHGDLIYYAAEHDTLIHISERFTGTEKHWQEIGRINHIGNDRTIPIGTAIVVPANLLADEPGEAQISAFAGEVRLTQPDGTVSAAAVGSKVVEACKIQTGNSGFVTLALKDGSHASLPSNSQITVKTLRNTRFTASPRTIIDLVGGYVESRVSPLDANKGQYEIHSTLANAGVRGTHFRVGVLEQGIGNEVLSGVVAVGTAQKPATLALEAGKGNVIDSKGVGTATALLAAPQVMGAFALQERPTVQFQIQALEHAVAYHAQISRDEQGQDIIAETRSNNERLRINGLQDGNYYLHLRAVDQSGLEGIPRVEGFHLKATPVPPFPSAPRTKLRADHVEFAWIEAPQANSYHLQLASDAQFKQILIDEPQVSGLQFSGKTLPPGRYFWRAASVVIRNGVPDQGPYSDIQNLDLLPPQASAEVADKGDQINFNWPAEPGQKFLVQIARDTDFKSLLVEQNTEKPEISIARPDVGTYFVRVKATDTDGYVGAFSATQKFAVQSRWLTGNGTELKSDGGSARAGY